MNKVKLLCLPFAGGSSYSYQRFEEYLPPNLELINPELPGRGQRIAEPLLTDLQLMADDIIRNVADQLAKPYAIYGHSMGALLAYLLTHRILAKKLNPPLHLFLSGRAGPAANHNRVNRHDLPQQEFFQVIRDLGGCPEEVLNDHDMMEFFEPVLRSDFQAVETYQYHSLKKLAVPIDVFIGLSEDISRQDAELWEAETAGEFQLTMMEGDHFFIHDKANQLIEHIIKKLDMYGK